MKTYVFDIDGTICTNTNGTYEEAKPYKERIQFINRLFDEGNKIKYFTARGSSTGINWYEITKKQLDSWHAKYHELITQKPEADIYIDDKAFNSNKWILPNIDSEITHARNNQEFIFKRPIFEHLETLNKLITDEDIAIRLKKLCNQVKETFKKEGKIIFAGNGGSFADSQHLAAEFVCKFNSDRIPLPAISLGTNSSTLTAIGNDYGYEYIFSRELKAIGTQKDVLIAFSTSGNSKNIINLINQADALTIPFYIFTGKTGGMLNKYDQASIKVPSENTAIIQQIHIMLGHLICTNTEQEFIKN